MNIASYIKTRIQKTSIFVRFVFLGTLVFLVIGFFLVSFVEPLLTDFILRERELSSVVFANRLASDMLQPEDFLGLAQGESKERFERFTNNLQVPGFFRIKVWRPDGTIIYSDEERLIGKQFPISRELKDALSLKTVVELETFDPGDPHHEYEAAFGRGIAAYSPITFGSSKEVVGVVETYARSGFLEEKIDDVRDEFVFRITLSLFWMFAVLSLIVWHASRTVKTQKNKIEAYASGLERMVKERTTELEREQVKLSQIAENMRLGTILFNNEGEVIFVNKSALALLGLRNEQDVRETLVKKFPGLKLDAHITQCLRGNPSTVTEAEANKRIYEISFYCLAQEHGGFFGHVVWIDDITDKTLLDRAKSEFVAIASHQLRTPLSTISWYAEMLLSRDVGRLTKQQEQYLKRIYQSNRRMSELINALLNVSRLELQTFIVEPKPVRIATVAEEVIEELAAQIHEKKLTIKKEYGTDIPSVNLDPNLVHIIFQNLLSNAVRYTSAKGTILLRITAEPPNLSIKVSDNGCGIPLHQQDKVFTKMFRADNAKEMVSDGTGLGLYAVKSILDQTGGSIRFSSKEGEGTTFYVILPLSGMKKKEGTRQLSHE